MKNDTSTGKNTRYSSFKELAEAMNSKKITKEDKKVTEKKPFFGKCPVCKQELSLVDGTNVVVCANGLCKGKPFEKKNEDGTKTIYYKPYYRVLKDKNEEN